MNDEVWYADHWGFAILKLSGVIYHSALGPLVSVELKDRLFIVTKKWLDEMADYGVIYRLGEL